MRFHGHCRSPGVLGEHRYVREGRLTGQVPFRSAPRRGPGRRRHARYGPRPPAAEIGRGQRLPDRLPAGNRYLRTEAPGSVAAPAVRLQHPAQVLHVGVSNVHFSSWWLLRPQRVHQVVPTYRLALGQHEQRQYRPPLRRTCRVCSAVPPQRRTGPNRRIRSTSVPESDMLPPFAVVAVSVGALTLASILHPVDSQPKDPRCSSTEIQGGENE